MACTRVVTLCLCAISALLAVSCAKATFEERGRDDEDASPAPKPVLPDARVPERPDAAGRPDASAADAGASDANCDAAPIDLLTNGNFDEGGGVGWTETSSGSFTLILAEGDPGLPDEFVVAADSPAFMAYLGGYNDGADLVQQEIALPADAVGVHLTGAARIDTLETIDAVFDRTFLEIADAGGAVLEELALFTNQDDTGDQYITFDIPVAQDFAGQTVRFQLRTTTDVSLDTHFFFDTLVLEATTCAAPRPGR